MALSWADLPLSEVLVILLMTMMAVIPMMTRVEMISIKVNPRGSLALKKCFTSLTF